MIKNHSSLYQQDVIIVWSTPENVTPSVVVWPCFQKFLNWGKPVKISSINRKLLDAVWPKSPTK